MTLLIVDDHSACAAPPSLPHVRVVIVNKYDDDQNSRGGPAKQEACGYVLKEKLMGHPRAAAENGT